MRSFATSNATIIGGAFFATGAGALSTFSGTTTLTDVALNGPVSVNAGHTLVIGSGGLINNNLLRINPTAGANPTILRFDATGALSGNGEIRLSAGGANAQLNALAGVTITNDAGQTIRGVGQINASLVNNGTITADQSVAQGNSALILQSTDKTNNAIMQAVTGSEFRIGPITITQSAGASLQANGTGAVISTNASAILGGHITSTAGGVLSTAGGTTTLHSVTLDTDTYLNHKHLIAVTGAGLTNNGIIRINFNLGNDPTALRFEEDGLLDGTGEIHLEDDTAASQIVAAPGVSIIHGASHTIRGTGVITAPITNYGTIISDRSVGDPLSGLFIRNCSVTNHGTLAAAAGDWLVIDHATIIQDAGGSLVTNGGDISALDATIVGGQINVTGGSRFGSSGGTNTLHNVTLNADSGPASIVVTGGSLVNNGQMLARSLRFDESGTLSGSGIVDLAASAPNAQIIAPAGVTITHAQGHSIVGYGQITATGSLVNLGTIQPHWAPSFGIFNLTVTGNLTNGHTGVYDIEIGGDGYSDRLIGTANHTLGGTLDLSLPFGTAYVPLPLHKCRIIQGNSVTGRFTTVLKPTLPPGLALRIVYLPDAVEVWFHCPPDLTTTAIPGQPGFGIPNGALNNDDFFFYLSLFASADPDADLTTTAIPGSPGYGVPNGVINNDDFFYYLAIFAAGC